MRARKYEQPGYKVSKQHRETVWKAGKRMKRHAFCEDSTPSLIIREWSKLLEGTISNDNEEKGKRTITLKLFRGLGTSEDRVMENVGT